MLDYLTFVFRVLDREWVAVLIDLYFAVPKDDSGCEVPIESSYMYNVEFHQRIKYDW